MKLLERLQRNEKRLRAAERLPAISCDCDEPLEVVLHREGAFDVLCTGDDSTQCGIRGTTRRLFYRVRIVGDEQHLTEEGFIIDNNEVHQYFVDKYREIEVFPSCERIVCQAVRDFKALFGKGHLENVVVNEIVVSVSGNPAAVGLQATWKADR